MTYKAMFDFKKDIINLYSKERLKAYKKFK